MTSWPSVLGPLMRHEAVPLDDIRWAMREIMAGAATPAQMAAFVVALRVRGEEPEQIAALVDVMLEFSERIDPHGVALDTCGTGGDGAHTVNISTMAATVLGAAGVPVVKHGNRAASSKCGSADVLEALGIRIDIAPAQAQAVYDELGITFCYAPAFHPALRFAGPTRREIGAPTTFNLLGPLANPAATRAQIVGVADGTKAQLLADALRIRGTSALVVRGEDGLDEVSLFAPTRVIATWLEAPVFLDPQRLGIPQHAPDSLVGQDAAYNAEVARRVLGGSTSGALAAVADAVLLNAAAGKVAFDAASGVPALDIEAAMGHAMTGLRTLLESGESLGLVERWAAATNA